MLDATFTPLEGYLVELGRGYKAPRRVRFEPPWSIDEWARLANRPLPMKDAVKAGNGRKRQRKRIEASSSEQSRRLQVLQKILTERKQLESWEAN